MQLICKVQRLFLADKTLVFFDEIFDAPEPYATDYIKGNIAIPVAVPTREEKPVEIPVAPEPERREPTPEKKGEYKPVDVPVSTPSRRKSRGG